jgi:hypothetical protein
MFHKDLKFSLYSIWRGNPSAAKKSNDVHFCDAKKHPRDRAWASKNVRTAKTEQIGFDFVCPRTHITLFRDMKLDKKILITLNCITSEKEFHSQFQNSQKNFKWIAQGTSLVTNGKGKNIFWNLPTRC